MIVYLVCRTFQSIWKLRRFEVAPALVDVRRATARVRCRRTRHVRRPSSRRCWAADEVGACLYRFFWYGPVRDATVVELQCQKHIALVCQCLASLRHSGGNFTHVDVRNRSCSLLPHSAHSSLIGFCIARSTWYDGAWRQPVRLEQ